MNLLLLLDMAASARGDEIAVQVGDDRLLASELLAAAWGAAQLAEGASALAYVGTNGLAFPIGLFASAGAGVPFVPLNYRLGDEQLHELLAPLGDVVVVASGQAADQLRARGHRVIDTAEFVATSRRAGGAGDVPDDVEGPAVLLYTSGTTAAPKAAVLRHRHLTSYVIGTVEFAAAAPDEAALVSVPPYHVAGLANLLSNLYLGRRIVYLEQFDAEAWVRTVRVEAITHAMVVPTMLARIADVLEADLFGSPGTAGDVLSGSPGTAGEGDGLPSLRALSYGGARTPAAVLQRAMAQLPNVDFTNAYGLTETSSTIALLGPDDHRAALDGDEVAIARLSSAGKVLPTIEVEVRDEYGKPVPTGQTGEIFVRGEQVSGEYRRSPAVPGGPGDTASSVDDAGWFPTRDRGSIDDDGYLFIEGRSDDTIIRGGENIAPAEIEEVLLQHPDIAQCAVVGVPDDEWGQRIAAVVVCREGTSLDGDTVRAFARESLRGSKTPDVVEFVDALPYTDTGKLLRRVVLADLAGGAGAS
jgi:acyl-CoA synthetase (AMP-forming)/AMP-acid ligase II